MSPIDDTHSSSHLLPAVIAAAHLCVFSASRYVKSVSLPMEPFSSAPYHEVCSIIQARKRYGMSAADKVGFAILPGTFKKPPLIASVSPALNGFFGHRQVFDLRLCRFFSFLCSHFSCSVKKVFLSRILCTLRSRLRA